MPDYWNAPTQAPVVGGGNYATNELPVDMHSKVLSAFPQVTPLTAILTRLAVTNAKNYRVDWQEHSENPTKVVVGTALASGGTSLVVVANGKTLVMDSLLFNPRTFDIAKVTTTPTTNTVTVTRDEGGTTGAAWNSLDVLYVLPPAVPENETDSTAGFYRNSSVVDSNVYNYIQLCRLGFAMTRIGDSMTTHFGGPGSKRAQLKMAKYIEMRKKWEQMLYMGGRASSGTDPATTRLGGGFVHYLRNGTLYKDFNGLLTESGFRNFLGDYKSQNPDSTNIMLFGAGRVLDQINDFGLGSVRSSTRSKEFGFDINHYKARGLGIDMVSLPLLTDPEGSGWGWILDLDRVQMKTLNPLTFIPDAKPVGQSENIYDTYRVATSLLVGNESRHAMFVGAKL